jgi:hypothetical protein
VSDTELFVAFWRIVLEDLDGSMSCGDMAELTHETQVGIYGWCLCEDADAPYDDCPNS